MLLPALWLPTLPLTGDELVRVRQGGAWVYPRLSDVVALAQGQVAATLASANATIVALAQRVAALEGKPDPCVALAGTLPIATLQIGTAIVQVPVAGLLSTDRVAVAPAGDPPAGLSIAWAHPDSSIALPPGRPLPLGAMPMTSPNFGIILNEVDDEPFPPFLADLSIGAIVSVSEDANPTFFSEDTPVAINSGDPTALKALGSGPLAKAVARVNAQLAPFEVSARLVLVRVAAGVDDAHTKANLLGNAALGTGIYALLRAPQVCSETPRLVIVPGFTGSETLAVTNPVIETAGQGYVDPVVTFTPPGAAATATVGNAGAQATGTASIAAGGVTGIAVVNHGSLYPAAPAVTLSGGGGGAGATAHAVIANGIVTGLVVDNAGAGYTAAPIVTVAAPPGGQITAIDLTSPGNYSKGVTPTIAITDANGGPGAGATATVSTELLTNEIAAALPEVLAKLLAHGLVGGPGAAKQDADDWRTSLPDNERLIPQDDWEIVATEDGLSTEYIDGVCRSLGLAIRNDFQHGGIPAWSWANQPIVGALGLKRIDSFSLTDGATDGQELLGAGIGITVRGDLSDTSLDDSGYVAVSYRNASSNPLRNLYNKSRMYDFINLALLKAIRIRLGKENITPQSVQNVLNDMAALNIFLQSKSALVGYVVGFKARDNTVDGLRAGKFTVYDNTETAAPILQVTVNRGLDRAALVAELSQLASQTETVSS